MRGEITNIQLSLGEGMEFINSRIVKLTRIMHDTSKDNGRPKNLN